MNEKDKLFLKTWNESDSVKQVMEKLNMTYSQVTRKAYMLRKNGEIVSLMYKPKGHSDWKIRGRKGGLTQTDLPKGFATFDKEKMKAVAIKGGETGRIKRPRNTNG